MAVSDQGPGSSPGVPIPRKIRKTDRRKMRSLDRRIDRLKYAVRINDIVNPPLAKKQRAKLKKLDFQRWWLRLRMKGYDVK